MADLAPTKETLTETPAATVPATEPAVEAAATAAAADPELQPAHHWLDQAADDDNDSALGEDATISTASISSSILHYRTVNGRRYHSESVVDQQYWGANDDRQSDSLDILHHAYTLAMDGKLHFAPLSKNIEQAVDIGTGTGMWAVDFGDEYPDCKVIGTDISPIQPTWVPPNVHFQIDDFLQEWTFAENSLDFVHTRWLIGSVADWTALFRQAYRTLKPGAWLESFEVNGFFESDDGSLDDKSAIGQWGVIFREGARKLGLAASFSPVREKLQIQAAKTAGFVDIHEKPVKIPISEWAKDPNLRNVGLYARAAIENDTEGIVGLMATQLGWSKEAIAVYAAQIRKEMRSLTAHAYYRGNVLWAQKPLE